MPQQQTITTTVQGIGAPKSGKGWMLTLAYQLAGSKYPTTLYGQDMGQVAGLVVGEGVVALIQKGNLKQGKDPKYDTSYYWDLVSITKQAGGGQAATPGANLASEPRSPAPEKPYAPPALTGEDRKNISIERQKAVAETVVLVVEAYKGWLFNGGEETLEVYLARQVPVLVASVRKSAPVVYASIHGSKAKDTRVVADADAEGNEG